MRFIKSFATLTLIIILLPFLSGCVHNCTEEISWHVSPSEKTISIDESFKINVDGTTCGGRKKVDLNWSFESDNTDIAFVDSEGVVTGIDTGFTRIAVSVGKGTVGTYWIDLTVK